jgi:exodeoxyribonuclease-5
LQSFVSDDYGDLDLPFNGVVVVDEASMIDRKMLDLLKKRAEDYGTKVIFMGDEAQIPPVNEGDISQAFTTSDVVHQLTRVERTASGNPLMLIFDKIRENIKSPKDLFKHESKIVKKDGEFHGVGFTSRPQSFAGAIKKAFGPDSKWQEDPDSARVIAYTNKQVAKWNNFVRREMWGEASSEQFLPGELLIAKDNVYDRENEMVISNSSEYRFNELLDTNTSGNYGYTNMMVTTADGAQDILRVVHTPQQLAQYNKHMKGLESAAKAAKNPSDRRQAWKRFYGEKSSAITAHKSQGSTFETVFIDEDNLDIRTDRPKEKAGFGSRERNSLKYVAFSRAQRMAVVLSSKTELDFMDKGFTIEEIVEGKEEKDEMRQAVAEAAVIQSAEELEAEFDDYVKRGYYSAWYRDKVKEVGQEQADEASRLIRIKKATDELGFEPELAEDNSTILNADHLIDGNFSENLNRIMVGNHGVYFEFNKEALDKEFAGAKFVKKRKQYDEYRTPLGNKLYVQTDTVNYADYKKDAIYLSKSEMFAEAEGYVDTGGVALLEDEVLRDAADIFGSPEVETPQDGKPASNPTIDAEVEIQDLSTLFALPKVPDLPEKGGPKEYAEHFDAYQEAKRSKDWFQHVKQKVGYKEANRIMQQIREYRVFQYFGHDLPVGPDGTVDVRGVEWFNPIDSKNFQRVVAANHGVFVEYKGETEEDGGVFDKESPFGNKLKHESDRFMYSHYSLTVGERQVFVMEMKKKMSYAPFNTGAIIMPLYAVDLVRDHKTITIDSINGQGFVSPSGKVIAHNDIDTFYITERHRRKKGGDIVSIVIATKQGEVFSTSVNHFSLQAYFKNKSTLSHQDRKELRRIAHDQLFRQGQLDETSMLMFSEEERLGDYAEIADQIEQEGREDTDFTGDSWFDLFKNRTPIHNHDAEDNFLDALGYRPGAKEQTEADRERKAQAKEDMDAAAVERRFGMIKRLSKSKEGKSQAHVIKEAIEQMNNNPLLADEGPAVLQWGKTGVPVAIDESDYRSYSTVIGQYLEALSKYYDVRSVIQYILKSEGDLYSLSQLEGFPNSFDEFLEYTRQQTRGYESGYVEKIEISEEGKQTRTVKTLEAIQQELPFDTYNRGEKAIRKFMNLPNQVLNTITQYFDGDYEDIARGEKIALQAHLNEEFSEYNPQTRKVSNIYFPFQMVEILILAAKTKHELGVKFPPLRLSKAPAAATDAGYTTKERMEKSQIKVGPTAAAQPTKPKTKTIERGVAKVSSYEAFKAQASTNKIIQSNWLSFYDAVQQIATEGLKTKGAVFQPQRIAAAMMSRKGYSATQEFRDLGRAETRPLKKHGYDVGVRQEHIDVVMKMWQNTRILDGTFDYHQTKLDAIGDLNIENFELLRGISQLGDSLPLRLTDEQETRRQFIPTINTRGSMVYDIKFFSEVTGEEITQEAVTGSDVDAMRAMYPDLEVTNARGLGSEKLVWVQWQTDEGWSEPVRMTVAKFKANKRTSKTPFKLSETEDSAAVIAKKKADLKELLRKANGATDKNKKKALMRKYEHQKRAYIDGIRSNWTQLFDWTHEDDMKRLVELARRRKPSPGAKTLVSNDEVRKAIGFYRELKGITEEIILVEEEGGDAETMKELYDQRRVVEQQISNFHSATSMSR